MMDRDDRLLAEMALRNWIILAVLLILSLFWWDAGVSIGILAGGVLAILNYRLLGRALVRLLDNPQHAAQKGFRFNYLFRLLFVACALYLLMVRGGLSPLALSVGLSVIVINILITMLKRLY